MKRLIACILGCLVVFVPVIAGAGEVTLAGAGSRPLKKGQAGKDEDMPRNLAGRLAGDTGLFIQF